MSILAKPICYLVGHRRARRRVWHDRLDLRAPCIRCATPLIRSYDKGWRPFLPGDAAPERISRDEYREQLKRENDLGGASADHPEIWARQLVATFGDPAADPPVDPRTLFDRLLATLSAEPSFQSAVAARRVDPPARGAVGDACLGLLGGSRRIPEIFLDPLAKYLLARAMSGGARAEAMPMGAAATSV